MCVACHGKDGVGITGDYPTLAGQHADYLARALLEYQRGDRKNAVMPNLRDGTDREDRGDRRLLLAADPAAADIKPRASFLCVFELSASGRQCISCARNVAAAS